MSSRSLPIPQGIAPSSPSDSSPPLVRYFTNLRKLKWPDRLSLILASLIALALFLLLSPMIMVVSAWQAGHRFLSR